MPQPLDGQRVQKIGREIEGEIRSVLGELPHQGLPVQRRYEDDQLFDLLRLQHPLQLLARSANQTTAKHDSLVGHGSTLDEKVDQRAFTNDIGSADDSLYLWRGRWGILPRQDLPRRLDQRLARPRVLGFGRGDANRGRGNFTGRRMEDSSGFETRLRLDPP